MKKKPLIIVAAIVGILLFVVVAAYGTVSPCGILEKKMRAYATNMMRDTDNALAGALAGAAIDRMIENEIGALGPAECLTRVINFEGRLEKNAISIMKSDLRNLAAAEEAYWADAGTYTRTPALLDFRASGLVEIDITTASKSGWAAVASHTATDKRCALYYGDIGDEQSPAASEGVVACTGGYGWQE